MRLKAQEQVLLWGANLWYLGEGMLGPLFAVFAQRVGGDVLDITWAWAIFLSVTGVGMIVVGTISDAYADRHGREWIMLAGYGLNAVFTFAYLLVHSPQSLFIVQAGLGIAMALASPTWDALYDKHSESDRDGYIWGLQGGMQRVAYALAILVGGFIVTTYSFSTLFVIMGTIQVIATIYQAKILKLAS